MSDMSGEPSMEEILSSIKRLIAEEGEGPTRGRRAGRPAPLPAAADDEPEVLELSDPIAESVEPVEPPTFTAAPILTQAEPPEPEPAMTAHPEPAPATPKARAGEPLLSPRTAEASRTALDSLSRLMVKPEPGSDGSLEGLVREMLRPMLREWLDLHLPAMVESMVETEIARITGQSR